jgi:hypothetical protein
MKSNDSKAKITLGATSEEIIKGSCPTCRSGIDPTVGTISDFTPALRESL